jgi:hypothetical protein
MNPEQSDIVRPPDDLATNGLARSLRRIDVEPVIAASRHKKAKDQQTFPQAKQETGGRLGQEAKSEQREQVLSPEAVSTRYGKDGAECCFTPFRLSRTESQ